MCVVCVHVHISKCCLKLKECTHLDVSNLQHLHTSVRRKPIPHVPSQEREIHVTPNSTQQNVQNVILGRINANGCVKNIQIRFTNVEAKEIECGREIGTLSKVGGGVHECGNPREPHSPGNGGGGGRGGGTLEAPVRSSEEDFVGGVGKV